MAAHCVAFGVIMYSRNYYKMPKTLVEKQEDVPECMKGIYKDYTKIRSNREKVGGADTIVMKCNCAAPEKEHVGTILEKLTRYSHAEILVEMEKSEEGWRKAE